MGLWRLQEVVHEITARCPADHILSIGGHRALFASMPGDQHNFGTVVIDELFRRDGWLTERMSGAETADLVRRVGADWFDLVGLTVSCDCHIATLPSVITALRSVSRNPRVCIMVGGRLFSADPGLAVRVGADGTASDARRALKVAADLVRVREGDALTP
jgi:methanogenic corrinoid protein MtbC1